MIDYDRYTKNAIRTESQIGEVIADMQFLTIVNIFICASQLLDLFKRQIFYRAPLDTQKATFLFDTLRQLVDAKTASEPQKLAINSRILHAAIGLGTESGEILESIINSIETGNFDFVNFGEELGDINWYQAIALDESKLDLQNILDKNIAKLKQRFPQKFSEESAIKRDLKKERSILEGE